MAGRPVVIRDSVLVSAFVEARVKKMLFRIGNGNISAAVRDILNEKLEEELKNASEDKEAK